MNNTSDKRSLRTIIAGVLGILAAIVIIAGIVVFEASPKNPSDKEVAQIVTNPDQFYGTRINISGKIDSVIGSRAFTIDNPGIAGGKLLVISRKSLEPIGGSGYTDRLFEPQDRITIDGRVQEFSLRKVEKELGTDLVDDVFAGWEGRPVIIADDVQDNK